MRGPAIERARHAGFPCGGFVPLAEGAGAVAVQSQHLRERRHAVRILSGVAGEGRRALHDRAGVHGVMVASGLERIARRRAQRRGVEVVELQAALRELVHGRRANRAAEGARPTEADIVDQHDHDVGRLGRRLDLESRRGLGVARIELLVGRRGRFRERQHRAVHAAPCGRRAAGCAVCCRRRRVARGHCHEHRDAESDANTRCAHHVHHLISTSISAIACASRRLYQTKPEMIRAGGDIALAAGADHVARAVLIGAEKRSAAMDAFLHAGFARIERGRRTTWITARPSQPDPRSSRGDTSR